MTPLITYTIHLDTERDATYGEAIDDITAYVTEARWTNGMADAYQEVSPPAQLALILKNHGDEFSPENAASPYYGKLQRGTLVRIRATYDGDTYQLYEGRIKELRPTLGEGRPKRTMIVAQDPMLDLLNLEYTPPFQEDVTTDEVLAPIFDDAWLTYPYASAYWLVGVAGHGEIGQTARVYDHDVTNFDTGKTEHEFAGDNAGGSGGISAQSVIRDYVAAELGGRFFFDTRTGQFVFHNRHRDALNTTIATSIGRDDGIHVEYVYGDDLANRVTLYYSPRDEGAAGSVLWSATNVPFTLQGGAQRKITARYRDPNNPTARVGGKDFLNPQPGVDYASEALDNTGAITTNSTVMSVQFGANSAEITLTNQALGAVSITTLQLRGTPLTIYDKQSVQSINVDGIAANDPIDMVRTLNALSDETMAQGYADLLVNTFGVAQARVARITQDADRDEHHAERVLNRAIGDRIDVAADECHCCATLDVEGLMELDSITLCDSTVYTLVGEEHELLGGANPEHPATLRSTWVLQPAARTDYWLVGIAGRGELDVATRLGL